MGYERKNRIQLSRGYANPLQAASTAGTIVNFWGVSSIVRKTSAGTSTQLYTLQAPPRKGIAKVVCCTNATSSRSCRLTAAAGSWYQSSGNSSALTKATFKKGSQHLNLLSLSTSAWAILNLSTGTKAFPALS